MTRKTEFIATHLSDPDIVLKLLPDAWANVYLSSELIDKLIEGGEIEATTGNASESTRLLGLFGRYDPGRTIVIPSGPGSSVSGPLRVDVTRRGHVQARAR